MYSERIERLLRDNNINVFDRIVVRIKHGGRTIEHEGLLMPRPETGNVDCLVIKLDNGYNIGVLVEKGNVPEIRLVRKASRGKQVENVGRTKIKGKVKEGKRTEKMIKKEGTGNVRRVQLPKVHVLGCGGTISSKVEYLTGAVYPAMSEEELISMFPEITDMAEIKAETVFSILSEDMTPLHWSVIAEEVKKRINNGADGIVITHGTDTMHYTSAALSFMLQNLNVPVILTGAQRSSDRGSTDARLNLLSAVLAAGSDLGEVGVCMHADLNDNIAHVHRGTRVRKMHTSRRDAFKTVGGLPLLSVDPWARRIGEVSPYRRRGQGPLKFDNRVNDNVAMVYSYPGIDPELIDSLTSYDGVVLVGTGLGHVSTNPFGDKRAKPIIKNVSALIESGIPVVLASQTIYGRVNLNVYTAGRMLKEAGVIGHLCDWTPETAYAKLCWVLGHTKDMKKVKREMETNMAGEITERSIVI